MKKRIKKAKNVKTEENIVKELSDEQVEQIVGGVVPPIPAEDLTGLAGSPEYYNPPKVEEGRLQGDERLDKLPI